MCLIECSDVGVGVAATWYSLFLREKITLGYIDAGVAVTWYSLFFLKFSLFIKFFFLTCTQAV